MMISRKKITPSNALVRLQELCARSEQCSHEILTKLHNWGIDGTVAAKILALLKRDRFVDDSRYAHAFARDKVVFNRWGRAKIKLAMIQKHIDRELIDEAIDEIDDNEYMTALIDVVASKARSMPETDSYESRTKILRHAASRGFEISLAVNIIKQPSLWKS